MFWIKAVAKIPAVNGTVGRLQLQGLCSPQQLIPKVLTQQRSQSRNGVTGSGTGSGPLSLLPLAAPTGTSLLESVSRKQRNKAGFNSQLNYFCTKPFMSISTSERKSPTSVLIRISVGLVLSIERPQGDLHQNSNKAELKSMRLFWLKFETVNA